MHKKKEEGFIARRTEALALVLLSSRPDLTVMNAPDNAGVDIIVSIVRKRINAFNHFGVILKGTSHGIGNLQDASQALMSILPRKAAQGTLSMPICIFLFSMVGDHGYYTWLREPTKFTPPAQSPASARVRCCAARPLAACGNQTASCRLRAGLQSGR
jgi:hypothetical protein